MELSSKAIELCRKKMRKGTFCGFEQMSEATLEHISEEEASKVFDELRESGVIDLVDGNIHISALGQHIFHMMLQPDQYIMIDNLVEDICARIYIRNTYYLCVMRDSKVAAESEYEGYRVDLLPTLEPVIGAFVYAMYGMESQAPSVINKEKKAGMDIRIVGKAWDKERNIISEIEIEGKYHRENICYQKIEMQEGLRCEQEESECEPHELVNTLTKWMFVEISKRDEGR